MFSVLIETLNDEERLARSLGALVGAVVEGVVRDVVVYDRGSTDRTHYVAEHAGCGFMADVGLPQALAATKAEWVLFIEPGARLLEGWTDAAVAHARQSPMPARFTVARVARPGFLSRLLSPNRALAQGCLARKAQVAAAARNTASVETLARGLAMRTLSGEIVPAEPGASRRRAAEA